MAPTTPAIDRYAVPTRRPHPLPSDQDAHARARAMQLTTLRHKSDQLHVDFAATMQLLQRQRAAEHQDVADNLLDEVRTITERVTIRRHNRRPDTLIATGPDEVTIRTALLGTRAALARAQRQLEEADVATLDAITELTATVDDRLERLDRQIRAIDYGVRQGGAA